MSVVEPSQRVLLVEEDPSGVLIANFNSNRIVEEETVQELGRELASIGQTGRKVILNFSKVDFLSSSVLGKLITFQKKLKANGGALRLCCIKPQIYEIFEITRLNTLFEIFPDEASALEMF
jgi:anti-sigma B factor antagonist